MTLRLPADLDLALRALADEDHRSLHSAVVHAVDVYLALRETLEVKADPEALRSLAEAREAVTAGDVVYGSESVHALVQSRHPA